MPPPIVGTDDADRERCLRELFDNLPALCAYWDRDLRNVIANRPYIRWFGLSPEQMVGMHIRDVLGEAVYAKNLPHITGVLDGREQLFERTLIDTHGVTHHTQASYVPDVVDEAVVGFYVLVTDVTPRVEAERALAEAQRLAELGSWQLDIATGAVTWSAEMYQIVGADPASYQPGIDTYMSRVHPADRDRLATTFQTAIETAVSYETEYRLIHPDGDIRDIHGRGHPETDGDGTVVRLRGTVQDVTVVRRASRELARTNRRLTEANQMKADMIGMLGHDVRQPLAALLGYLDELTDGWHDIPEQTRQADLRRASAAAHRLATLVDDILTMATLDTATVTCHPTPTRLAEALKDTAADTPIEINADPSAVALVDPFHLRQILTNLIGNATKYGQPPIVATATTDGTTTTVSIHDHGEGVPDEFVPQLFDRFTRATTGIATQKPGHGFGLYIIRRLAEANHGQLTYCHHQPHGACFTLTLPAPRPTIEFATTHLSGGAA